MLKQIMGGHAHLQFELLQVWILDMQEPLLSTQQCDLKGLLFQAVTDTGVTDAAVTDTKFSNLNKYQRAVKVQLSTAPGFPLGSGAVHTFTSTTLPGKYYINMALSFSDVSAVNGACVAAAVRAFSSAVVRFSPSSASAETSTVTASSEPLKLWDRLRSLVHGSVRLLSDKLTYTQLLNSSSSASGSSSDNSSSSSSSVQLSAVSVQFMYTLGHVSCDMSELALTVPLTARQQKGDPPQPLQQSPFHSPFGSGNLNFGSGTLSISENDVLADSDEQQQQLELNANANNSSIPRKQCVAYIPSLHVACGLTWECANKQVSKPLHYQQSLAKQLHHTQRLYT
jgi:hypothetical protein